MLPFTYDRPTALDRAVLLGGAAPAQSGQPTRSGSQFIAGGTNMTDYMKLGVMQPAALVDLNGVDDPTLRQIVVDAEGVRLGSLVRMSEVEDHAEIRRRAPVLVDSLKLAATRQIRNMAALGGNVLQRTRCEYFREVSWPCNKRNPGTGCAAMDGVNRQHAILGTSDACIATYHGDFAQALVALDAELQISGSRGARRLPFGELHRLPGDTPERETNLAPDEVITAIIIPLQPWMARSQYLKIRDRQSYAFALASAAVALDLDGDAVRDVRIGLGGLATVPWRSREAEAELKGKPLTAETAMRAAETAFASARTREHNAFKLALGKETLVRALLDTKEMTI